MDVPAEKEDLFNEIYDEHVRFLLEVPGVRSGTRMKGEPFEISIAGEIKSMPAPDPVYTAIYELDTPEVMQTAEWAEAVEKGRRDDNKENVLIKADRNVAFRDVASVIKAVSRVEGAKIHLAVLEAD